MPRALLRWHEILVYPQTRSILPEPSVTRANSASFAKTKSRATPKSTPDGGGVLRVAAVQMASGPNVAANLAEAERLIEMAVAAGARA